MRLFDKLKGQTNSWLQDEKNIDARKEQVFPSFLKVTDEIESIWTTNPGYEKVYSDTMIAKSKNITAPSTTTKRELDEALELLNSIKKLLIYEHSERIYSLTTIIQGLQRSNIDLWPYIGEPADLEQILGHNGSKLKNKDIAALLYIDGIIERGENLKIELTSVRTNKMRREANKFFRR